MKVKGYEIGPRADLCGANLRGADLCGADLRGTDLRGANLRGANLRGANLREANLREANLREADLCGADLYGADLREANLRGADLYGAKWGDVEILDIQRRFDYYNFVLLRDGIIKAGCRSMSLSKYEVHLLTYKDSYKTACTKAILDKFRRQLKDINPSSLDPATR